LLKDKTSITSNYGYLCPMNKKKQANHKVQEEKRPVETYFTTMDLTFSQGNKGFYAFFLFLVFFGVMGLIWMIPFPQFQFLINLKMNTFLNWGSFFIAITIYCYLKLAPTLSYAVLFCIGIMSFFIVQLEYIEQDGGPSVILCCGIAAIIGFLGLIAVSRKEKNVHGREVGQMLTLGPVWLWSKVFDKFKIKY